MDMALRTKLYVLKNILIFDKYLKGEITVQEAMTLLEVMRPKQLKPSSEFPGYS